MKLLKSAAKRFLSGTIVLSMIAIPTTIANAGTNISCLDSTNNEITSNFNGSDNQIITSNEPQKQMALSATNSDVQKVSTEDGFEFEISQGIATLTKYIGQTKNVVIPSSVNGYTVAAIGQEAFRTEVITSVTIPSSVKEIGEYAFEYCESLTSVNMSNGVTKIGRSAFYHCISLKNITIPNSVTEIGWGAFYKCTSFTSIVIPNSVTSVGSTAFANCSSLTNITISNNVKNIEFNTFSGCSSLKSVIIPNSVTSIDQTSFQNCSSLISITIPNSVTEIGQRAFSGCSSLTSITVPNSVKTIMEGAFSNCSSLTNINVSTGNSNYCSINGIVFNKEKTYLISYPAGKSGTYNIPNSVKEIRGWAFSGCSSLTNITIPNSVTAIGYNAFLGCSSLTSMNVPNSVIEIRGDAFRDCKSLTSINLPSIINHQIYGATDWNDQIWSGTFWGCNSLTSITIPNNIKTIGDNAFAQCSSLKNIKIPNDVTYIGEHAFFNCRSLTNLIIPNSVVKIARGAFTSCDSLTSINIPSGITKIEAWTFEGCSSLTSINIPNSVTEIGSTAFVGCSSLKNITIPNGVKKIEEITFAECSSLTSVTIPNNVVEIGNSAFRNCSSLTSIIIPSSVTKIGETTFNNCNKLTIYGSKGSYAEEYAKKNNIPFKVFTPLANISTISANNIVSGNTIIFTGKASGGISSYQYRFAAKHSTDSKYTVLKDYKSAATSFVWKPRKTGKYTVLIRVKDNTGKVASKTYDLTVKTSLANNSTISANTIVTGDTITFTGKANGGKSSYQYHFAAKHSTDSKYTILKDYNSTATSFVWKPKKTGTYTVLIRVKDKIGDIASKTYTLTVKTPLANNSTISAKDIVKGDTIKFTGKASGGISSYQYRFAAKHSTDSKYTILKDYKSTATSFVWKPRKTGTYSVLIRVKDKTGKVASKTYTLTVDAPLVNNSIISSNTAVVGETVLIAARVSGGTAPYKAAYYCKKSTDTKWTSLVMVENDYTTLSKVYFDPNEATNYNICIKVKDAKGRVAKKYFTLTVKAPLANS